MDRERAIKLLGLRDDATPEDVRRALRSMQLRYHPDRHPDANEVQQELLKERFQEVNDAANFLLNSSNRASASHPSGDEADSGNWKSESNDDDAGVLLLLGIATAIGDSDWDLVLTLAQMLAGSPDHIFDAFFHAAQACFHLQRYQLAISLAENATRVEPGDDRPWAILAFSLAFSGERNRSAIAIAKAISLTDHPPQSYIELRAQLASQKGLLEKLKDIFDDHESPSCPACGTVDAFDNRLGCCGTCNYVRGSRIPKDRRISQLAAVVRKYQGSALLISDASKVLGIQTDATAAEARHAYEQRADWARGLSGRDGGEGSWVVVEYFEILKHAKEAFERRAETEARLVRSDVGLDWDRTALHREMDAELSKDWGSLVFNWRMGDLSRRDLFRLVGLDMKSPQETVQQRCSELLAKLSISNIGALPSHHQSMFHDLRKVVLLVKSGEYRRSSLSRWLTSVRMMYGGCAIYLLLPIGAVLFLALIAFIAITQTQKERANRQNSPAPSYR